MAIPWIFRLPNWCNLLSGGLPRQCAHWLAMTCSFLWALPRGEIKEKAVGTPLPGCPQYRAVHTRTPREGCPYGKNSTCLVFPRCAIVVKCKNPQRTRLRIIAKRRGKMKKKCFSTFILSGNYEEKKGGNMKKVLSCTYSSISSIFIDL